MNTIDAIIKRKGVRSFTDKELSKEQLKILIHAANAAAISGGGRPGTDSARQITIIQSIEILNKIETTIENTRGIANALYNARTLIILSAPHNQFHAEQFDCALSIQNIALAATELDLNSIIMTGVIRAVNSDKDLKNALNLPEGFEPLIAIAVGYTNNTDIKVREYFDSNVNYI